MAHPKGVLIERLQNEGRQPRFVTNVDGPDHEPTFHAEVVVDDDVLGRGDGGTKRTAERRAAEEALAALDAPDDDAPAAPAKKSRRRGSRGGKRNGPAPDATPDTTDAAPDAAATRAAAGAAVAPDDAPFDGPWPVFESVLASSVRVAHERVAVGLHGDEAREAVGRFALQLYKELLLDLGEIAWDDEDAD